MRWFRKKLGESLGIVQLVEEDKIFTATQDGSIVYRGDRTNDYPINDNGNLVFKHLSHDSFQTVVVYTFLLRQDNTYEMMYREERT